MKFHRLLAPFVLCILLLSAGGIPQARAEEEIDRPPEAVTVYTIQEEDVVWEVFSDTPLEEAARWQDTVTMAVAEENNPYGDPLSLDFLVTWSAEEYEMGIASGAASFSVSGTLGEPDWDAMAGLVRAEGVATATVNVRQPPEEPEVYCLYPYCVGGDAPAYTIYLLADDTAPVLPAEERFCLEGTTPFQGQTRSFSIVWDVEALNAGLMSEQESFSISGTYGPGNDWHPQEVGWWAEGLIRVADDTPAPQVEVHVIRDEAYPFQVQVVNRGGDYVPQFSFPWISGVETVTCAISFDKETWYEETLWAEDYDMWGMQWQQFPDLMWGAWYDEDWNEITIPADGTFYAKLTVTGAALPGESDVFALKPDGEQWEMIPDDGGTGDHGGGGQGQHDRPGKEEPEEPEEPDVPEETPSDQGSGGDTPSTPVPEEPDIPDNPQRPAVPQEPDMPNTPEEPDSSGQSQTPADPGKPDVPEMPEDAQSSDDLLPPEMPAETVPSEESHGETATEPTQEIPPSTPISGGVPETSAPEDPTPESSKLEQPAAVEEPEPAIPPTNADPSPEPPDAAEEEPAQPEAPGADLEPEPSEAGSGTGLPGYTVAAAATVVLLVGGGIWFSLRRKK